MTTARKAVTKRARKAVPAKLVELRGKAREHRKAVAAKLEPRSTTKLLTFKSVRDVVSYRAALAAGRAALVNETQVTLFARSWNPKQPLSRLQRLVIATAVAQAGGLRPIFATEIWQMWEDIEWPAKQHVKATELLALIGFDSLDRVKAAARKRR